MGIPRGGLDVAAEVAAALGCDLDVVVPRKLPAPFNEELAIGAVAEDGTTCVDPRARGLGIDDVYIEAAKARQLHEIQRRLVAYRGDRRPPELRGRTVIVVDDGIATGATMIAALRFVRTRGARTIVAAVPVAPPSVFALLSSECEDVVCRWQASQLAAVGQAYEDFHQVSDEEVKAILRAAWDRTT